MKISVSPKYSMTQNLMFGIQHAHLWEGLKFRQNLGSKEFLGSKSHAVENLKAFCLFSNSTSKTLTFDM